MSATAEKSVRVGNVGSAKITATAEQAEVLWPNACSAVIFSAEQLRELVEWLERLEDRGWVQSPARGAARSIAARIREGKLHAGAERFSATGAADWKAMREALAPTLGAGPEFE